MESLLHRLPPEIGSDRDSFGIHLFSIMKIEQGSIRFREQGQAVVENLQLLLPGVAGTLSDLVDSGIEMIEHRFLAMNREASGSSVVSEHMISCDAPQPWGEWAIPIETIQSLPGGDQGLLVHVIHGGRILHQGPDEDQQHGRMFPDQDLEGGSICGLVVDGGAPWAGRVIVVPIRSGDAELSNPSTRYRASMSSDSSLPPIHATTILSVRDDEGVAIAGDGQVTLGAVVAKSTACKIRRLRDVGAERAGVLVGFAGGAADAFALLERFEGRLKASPTHLLKAAAELARDWRSDRALRRLEAMMIVADLEKTLIVSGQGDLIEPDDGIAAIGSGGHYALAAARALRRQTKLSASIIAQESMQVAGELCVYTNTEISMERLPAAE